MEFGILGPLEVRFGGRPLELRRVKERTLLALLLLRVNQVVSLDHLASGLWEDAEAPRPPATLRVHVSRLRQALAVPGESTEQVVVTSGRGYALQVPADAVDAWRFEQLALTGRRQLADDPVGAAETLAGALALWRGPVLADLTLSPAVEPEVVRLEEARLGALEDRVEAELACGHHHELVGELEQLVTESPLRERLWGQRMIALYRCGRQAEALRAYEDLRVLLGEELGIRPSPALRQLERAVLDQDPALERAPLVRREPTAVTTPVPGTPGGARADEAGDEESADDSHLVGDHGRRPPAGSPGAESAMASRRQPPAGGAPAVRFPARLVSQSLLPLSGRQSQLEFLLDAWAETAASGRRVVLLSGEAGIGKTRLAAELAARAHDMGAVVLFGRCDEDMGVPFQPFVEALEQVLQSAPAAASLGRHAGELVRLAPDLAWIVPGLEPPLQADPDTERYRLFDAVGDWLTAMSAEAGMVLVLDDIHWAEKPTLLLLRHLVRSAEPMRILVVGTYRDTDLDRTHPLSEMLADLRREPCVERLALTGLDVGGVRDMLANAGDERVDARAAELGQLLWSETDGNPFFVQEILRSLVESGRLTEGDGRPAMEIGASELGIPEGVREVVGRRLSRLSPTANAVLALASVIGAVIDFDVVVAVSDLSEDAVLDALDEATAASLLRETSSGAYEFTHALVRSTLYDELSAARRARRHRQVAEALEARDNKDAAALAYHFQRAGSADARSIEYAAAAGEQALERLAFDQAVAFFSQALEAADDVEAGADRRCGLLVRLGTAQRLAAVPAYRETLLGAARLAQDLGDAELLAQAALANNRGISSTVGIVDEERVQFIEAALDAIGPADSATRARLLSVLALELIWRDPELRRLALADEAVAMARRLGDDACLLDVWTAAHIAASVADRVPALVAELPDLLVLGERIGDVQQLVVACGWGSLHCVEMGDLDEADRLVERIGRLVAEVNNPFFRWIEANYHCCRLTVSGTGDEIEQAALTALQIGQDAGQPDLMTWFAPQLLIARWSQGRLGEIVELVRQVTADTPGVPAWRAALALTCAQLGDRDEAVSIIDDLMSDPAKAFPENVAWLLGHSVLAEAVAAVGTAAQAAREYPLLEPYAGRVPCLGNVARPGVSLALAGLAGRAGWRELAERHFSEAHALHLRLGATGWLARTQLEWGAFLLDTGESTRAEDLLIRARDTAEQTGAADVVEAARGLLAAAGAHHSGGAS
ncbi:MAG: BTAD domain-containing putative transcriptional regulator [Acidimicrobiales bacterium]